MQQPSLRTSPMIDLAVDAGEQFGRWPDNTSRFLYFDSTAKFLDGLDLPSYARVGDYGGGNGLLKTWLPQSISIDSDAAKAPDILDDILDHSGSYDLIVLRYVLHYLSDQQIARLFASLQEHRGEVWIIQFASDGESLAIKQSNSVNEGVKHLRDTLAIFTLASQHLRLIESKAASIEVAPDFYRHRLNNPDAVSHHETVYFLRGKIK